MLDSLSESDLAVLDALRHGETANGYARRISYSVWWAKKKSRQVRAKLGVASIEEALAVSEGLGEGITRAEFDGLQRTMGQLADALEQLQRAKPADQPAAQAQVRERELDVKDHAKALGISVDDVRKLPLSLDDWVHIQWNIGAHAI